MIVFRPAPQKKHIQAVTPQRVWQWSGAVAAPPTITGYLIFEFQAGPKAGAFIVLKQS